MIDIGDTAPDFTLPATGGAPVTLSALAPERVVVYFYPKDGTPGCSLEAHDFSTLLPEFEAAGATVIGISKDSLRKHENAVAKQGLALRLASDAEGDICERWGVWAEKKLYGRTHVGIVRSTFIVGPDGRVTHRWSPVKVAGHAAAVLDAVKAG